MRYFVLTLTAAVALTPVEAAAPDKPPYLRTGADLVSACDTKTSNGAYRCSGMIEAIGDSAEAARWKAGCPPTIELSGLPPKVMAILEAARDHPSWTKLPAAAFVDKAERLHRCPQTIGLPRKQ